MGQDNELLIDGDLDHAIGGAENFDLDYRKGMGLHFRALGDLLGDGPIFRAEKYLCFSPKKSNSKGALCS